MPHSHDFLKSKQGRLLFTNFLNNNKRFSHLKNAWMLYKNIKKFKGMKKDKENFLLSEAHMIYAKYLKSEKNSYYYVSDLDVDLISEVSKILNGKDGDGLGDVNRQIFDKILPVLSEKLAPALFALEKSPLENDIMLKNKKKSKRKLYDKNDITTWDVNDVVLWLDEIGLPLFAIAITHNGHEIQGEDLLDLSKNELEKELGLSEEDIKTFKKNLKKFSTPEKNSRKKRTNKK